MLNLFSSLVLSLSVQAAKPNLQAIDLIMIPEASRLQTALGQPKAVHKDLIRLAFTEKEPMANRWKALTLAVQMDPAESQKHLERAFKQSNWFMKNAALVALTQVSPEEGEKAALKLLSDKALIVRSAAVRSIRDDATPEIRNRLWEELKAKYNFKVNESLWVRAEIVEKLAKNPEKSEYPLFAKVLADGDDRLYKPAILALEKLTNRKQGSSQSTLTEMRNLWISYTKKKTQLL